MTTLNRNGTATAGAAIAEEVIDLSKLMPVKLKTLVESLDLDLKQGAQEKVPDFALRVRDAIRAKAK